MRFDRAVGEGGMYNLTTKEFNEAILRSGRRFTARIRANDFLLEGLTEFNISSGSNDGDALTLGSTIAQTVTITMDEPTVSISRTEFKLEVGLLIGGEAEYIPMGLFMPEKIQSKAGKITFIAYDRMMWLSPEYTSVLPENTDTVSVLSEISKNTGVPIVKEDLTPISIKRPSDVTYRDMLSYIAQLYGCFANVNREGVIEFHFWTDTGYTLTADQGISGFENSGSFTVAMIQVNNDGTVLSAGSGGKGIVFDNSFMTQARLNTLFKQINGFSYDPVKCPVILGDPRLDPWDLITVVDAAEKEYRVPIMALTYNYDGGLSMEITSTIADASDTEFDYKSPYKIFKEDTAKRLREAKEAAVTAKNKADNALQYAEDANAIADDAKLAATTAQESANQAQTAAAAAQSSVDQVGKDVESLEDTVNQADAIAKQAKEAADAAETKASEAREMATNAQKDAADAKGAIEEAEGKADAALEKAEAATADAADAKSNARAAQETAAAAKLDAEQAQKDIDALDDNLTTLRNTMSAEYARKTDLTESEARLQTQITQNAGEISSTATKVQKIDETANNAAQQAQAAQTMAEAAQTQADQAVADAEAAQLAADAAALSASNAQSEADNAKSIANTAQEIADAAQANLDAAKRDLATVSGRVDATEADIEAAQIAVDKAQAAADKAKLDADTAVKKAADAQSAADTAVSNAADAQEAADNAVNKASVAQAVADAAQADATAAKKVADDAKATATAAQDTANAAKSNADNAQAVANSAAADAANAQKAADDADAKAAQAQTDLNAAKENLADVTSRIGATEAEVEAAQADVVKAQAAADKAKAEAQAAQSAADQAKADAATAQTVADNAKLAADAAQSSADQAQAAADAAQKDVDALTVRVTTAETKITQNSEKIALLATKAEVTEALGGYYKKAETESLIEQSASEVRIAVSSEIDEKINDTAESIHETITEQNTALTNTCKEIILEALTTYTETKDFETFKETVSSQLTLMSDEMNLKFTESTKQVASVNNDLQEKFNTITKYFTFDINGLTIGQVDNPYKVIIDNDRYSMTVNDVEVMWIADGKVYTPELEVSRAFKLFSFLIDQDGSGNLNCEYIGGEG